MMTSVFATHLGRIKGMNPIRQYGRVTRVVGLIIEASGPPAGVGDLCYLHTADGREQAAEVVGFKNDAMLLMPLEDVYGVAPGCLVSTFREPFAVPVGDGLLGRILDGLGRPIDDLGPLPGDKKRFIYSPAPDPMKRALISQPLYLGIRAVDGLLTLGKGQRVGIFAGSGVGKSVLLGMIARNTAADINVIALVGERGREVREFIERDLGEEGLARSVVVAATSDKTPMARVKGALVATTVAEYFRDQGRDVLLMMDSVTRFCMAQREIGLAAGEPPATKGYPPSVFANLPKLMERAGTGNKGSITALYTVLVEGDDLDEPVADSARSILDGHIVLSRKLADRGHYPAVDILPSVSRLMSTVAGPDQRRLAKLCSAAVSVHREAEDLINIGAYAKGANPAIDDALARMPAINEFLRQDMDEKAPFEETLKKLTYIFRDQR